VKVYDKAKMKSKNFARLDREVRSITCAPGKLCHNDGRSASAGPQYALTWQDTTLSAAPQFMRPVLEQWHARPAMASSQAARLRS